jgi:hypothetical protein
MPQIQTTNQPVTQITIVEPEPGKQAEALSLMTERARFMSKQPGFVSISLHRSLDGSDRQLHPVEESRAASVGAQGAGLPQGVEPLRPHDRRDRPAPV